MRHVVDVCNIKLHPSVQASQASATDLRLWSSYVQLLALLGSRREAVKVAEKALSMVQVKNLCETGVRCAHRRRMRVRIYIRPFPR